MGFNSAFKVLKTQVVFYVSADSHSNGWQWRFFTQLPQFKLAWGPCLDSRVLILELLS